MLQKQPNKSSFRESLKALEADIHHANSMAAALPRDYGGNCCQMRLSYSPFAPFILYLIEWIDYSCTDTLPSSLGLLHVLVYKAYVDRKATLWEFYAVIYPWLRQLGDEFIKSEDNKKDRCTEVSSQKKVDDCKGVPDKDSERDDECGICMEDCTKLVLPNCGHALCISCFHEWYSQFPPREAYLGHVINTLTKPIDGRGEISASESRLIESPAPGMFVHSRALSAAVV